MRTYSGGEDVALGLSVGHAMGHLFLNSCGGCWCRSGNQIRLSREVRQCFVNMGGVGRQLAKC